MKKKLILLTLVIVVLFGLYWLSGHSFIEITVEGQTNDGLEYSLVNQGKGSSAKITGKKVKRLVGKGSYELTVEDDKSSYFSMIKAGGFLRTKTISVKLSPENARSFIGDNPNTCVTTVNNILLSLACGDTFDQLKVHVPASLSQPTLAKKAAASFDGLVEGFVQNTNGTTVIVKEARASNETGPHFAYSLGADGSISNPIHLSRMDEDREYTISPYLEGFMALSTQGDHALAYSSIGGQGEVLAINEKPRRANLTLESLISFDSSVAFVYTDSPDITGPSFDSREGVKSHSEEFEAQTRQNTTVYSEVLVPKDKKVQHFTFKVPAIGITFCGQDKLCTLNDGVFEVFDISKHKASSLYKISGVNAVDTKGSRTLLVRETDILVFDPTATTGYVSYKFGRYVFCGLQQTPTGYVLCIANDRGKRTALNIDLNQPDKDNIDQKVHDLINSPYASEVSVYGKFIHVLPDVGEPEINPESGYYEYSPAKIAAAKASLENDARRLGIDTSVYTIISALQ